MALTLGAAHDLSTPLCTIAVIAKDLEGELACPDRAQANHDDIRGICNEVERCRGILGQLALDARSTRGEVPAQVTAGGLLRRLSDELDARGSFLMTVDSKTAMRTLRLPIRATLLALRNLVTNGWRAMGDAGQVLIHASAWGDVLTISIEDTGVGMGPELLRRALEPTFTTHASAHHSGWGLFLTKLVLDSIGGALRLRSRPGVGTVAIAQLPMDSAP